MNHIEQLTASNRAGYRSFLTLNVIYARLTLALCAALLVTLHAHAAESLPSAPTPHVSAPAVFTTLDYTLAAGLIAGRALDYSTTSQCLRNTSRNGCHETLLPKFIVGNKAKFAAFEIGTASLEIFSMYELRRHGHPRLARSIAAANVGLSLAVDAHNYSLARR